MRIAQQRSGEIAMNCDHPFNHVLSRRSFVKGTAMAAAAAAGLEAWPRAAHAQTTDPVPADRLIYGGTWEGRVGVTGSIPARSTIAQTLGPTATASQINT